ncbi:MAG TPA: hypothetical protein VNW92_04880 [Polyangiaceae bacterium]|jgi:uncharacterized repeat protein (TIGR03806 family)|nr:hypothetical protein [Polyangiaceae bacterium]
MLVSKAIVGLGALGLVAACSSTPNSNTAETGGSGGMSGSAATVGGSAGAAGISGNGAGTGGGSAGSAGSGGTSAGGSGGAGVVGTCTPPADVFSPIENLSQTGCVDPTDPRKPIARAVTYELNSPLWSDSADKERAFVLPAGGKIHVRDCTANASDCPMGTQDDGRWNFPVGTVMIKIFMFDAKLVETRLFMHLDADNWVGYSYEWDEAQTEAKIVTSDRMAVMFNTGTRTVPWHYPSQQDCLTCHNAAAGSTLGPETAQMNRMVGGMNQLDQFTTLGLFETPPAKPYKAALVTPYTGQLGSPPPGATKEQLARSYLHANCGFCHRPGGAFALIDLRNDTLLKDTNICNKPINKAPIPSAPNANVIMTPGSHMDSVLWLRMNEADPTAGRMPQIASYAVDTKAVGVVGDWIDSLTDCNQP